MLYRFEKTTTIGTNMEIELVNDCSSNSVEICTTFRCVSTLCVGVLITNQFRKSIRQEDRTVE